MAISVRSVTVGTNTGSSATVSATTPSGGSAAQVDDVLVIIHGNDFYLATNMPTPTVSPGSPTVTAITGGTADHGLNEGHIKSYTAVVNTAGAQTVSVTETDLADEEKCMVVYVLSGVNTTTPIDVADNTEGDANENQTCPSVTTTATDDLLICHNNSGPSSTAAYTSPGSMTEQYEIHVGGMSGVGATEQLVASGATGTRTFNTNPGDNINWVSVSIAVKAAAAAATRRPATLVIPEARHQAQTDIYGAFLSAGPVVLEGVQENGIAVVGGYATSLPVKVAKVLGLCTTGALASSVASKLAPEIGTITTGARTTGTAAKVAPETGVAVGGAAGSSTAAKRVTGSGLVAAGGSTLATAVKVAVTQGVSAAGGAISTTATKVAQVLSATVAGGVVSSTATKVAQAVGSLFAGGYSLHSGIAIRAQNGICAAGASVAAVARKVAALFGYTSGGGVASATSASSSVFPLTADRPTVASVYTGDDPQVRNVYTAD